MLRVQACSYPAACRIVLAAACCAGASRCTPAAAATHTTTIATPPILPWVSTSSMPSSTWSQAKLQSSTLQEATRSRTLLFTSPMPSSSWSIRAASMGLLPYLQAETGGKVAATSHSFVPAAGQSRAASMGLLQHLQAPWEASNRACGDNVAAASWIGKFWQAAALNSPQNQQSSIATNAHMLCLRPR